MILRSFIPSSHPLLQFLLPLEQTICFGIGIWYSKYTAPPLIIKYLSSETYFCQQQSQLIVYSSLATAISQKCSNDSHVFTCK